MQNCDIDSAFLTLAELYLLARLLTSKNATCLSWMTTKLSFEWIWGVFVLFWFWFGLVWFAIQFKQEISDNVINYLMPQFLYLQNGLHWNSSFCFSREFRGSSDIVSRKVLCKIQNKNTHRQANIYICMYIYLIIIFETGYVSLFLSLGMRFEYLSWAKHSVKLLEHVFFHWKRTPNSFEMEIIPISSQIHKIRLKGLLPNDNEARCTVFQSFWLSWRE